MTFTAYTGDAKSVLAFELKIGDARKNPGRVQHRITADWLHSTTDGWTGKCFDTEDLRCTDRLLFGS